MTLKRKGMLRGCIGQIIGHEPLRESIRRMALAAAFEDPRFPPLALSELDGLHIHVSLLTEPTPVRSYKDIRVGIDGIIVSCGWKKGVYLPEVAIETGWDAKTFLKVALLKRRVSMRPSCLERRSKFFRRKGLAGTAIFDSEEFVV